MMEVLERHSRRTTTDYPHSRLKRRASSASNQESVMPNTNTTGNNHRSNTGSVGPSVTVFSFDQVDILLHGTRRTSTSTSSQESRHTVRLVSSKQPPQPQSRNRKKPKFDTLWCGTHWQLPVKHLALPVNVQEYVEDYYEDEEDEGDVTVEVELALADGSKVWKCTSTFPSCSNSSSRRRSQEGEMQRRSLQHFVDTIEHAAEKCQQRLHKKEQQKQERIAQSNIRSRGGSGGGGSARGRGLSSRRNSRLAMYSSRYPLSSKTDAYDDQEEEDGSNRYQQEPHPRNEDDTSRHAKKKRKNTLHTRRVDDFVFSDSDKDEEENQDQEDQGPLDGAALSALDGDEPMLEKNRNIEKHLGQIPTAGEMQKDISIKRHSRRVVVDSDDEEDGDGSQLPDEELLLDKAKVPFTTATAAAKPLASYGGGGAEVTDYEKEEEEDDDEQEDFEKDKDKSLDDPKPDARNEESTAKNLPIPKKEQPKQRPPVSGQGIASFFSPKSVASRSKEKNPRELSVDGKDHTSDVLPQDKEREEKRQLKSCASSSFLVTPVAKTKTTSESQVEREYKGNIKQTSVEDTSASRACNSEPSSPFSPNTCDNDQNDGERSKVDTQPEPSLSPAPSLLIGWQHRGRRKRDAFKVYGKKRPRASLGTLTSPRKEVKRGEGHEDWALSGHGCHASASKENEERKDGISSKSLDDQVSSEKQDSATKRDQQDSNVRRSNSPETPPNNHIADNTLTSELLNPIEARPPVTNLAIAKAPVVEVERKKKSRAIGLRNLGNSCYINASLQMLYSLQPFVNDVQHFQEQIRSSQKRAIPGEDDFRGSEGKVAEAPRAVSPMHDHRHRMDEKVKEKMNVVSTDPSVPAMEEVSVYASTPNKSSKANTGKEKETDHASTPDKSSQASTKKNQDEETVKIRSVEKASKKPDATKASKDFPLYSSITNVFDALKPPAANDKKNASNNNVATAKRVRDVMDKLVPRYNNLMMGFGGVHGRQQHDANEFVLDLLEQMHVEEDWLGLMRKNQAKASVSHASKESECSACNYKVDGLLLPTDAHFQVNVKVTLICDACGYTRSQMETYRHLSLDVTTPKVNDESIASFTVQEGLRRFFAPETRDVSCEKCKDGKTCTQTMEMVGEFPRALLLHLKRFTLDSNRSAGANGHSSADVEGSSARVLDRRTSAREVKYVKNRAEVFFPSVVQMDPFMTASACNQTSCHKEKKVDHGAFRGKYHLRSVVHHIGRTPFRGHYIADALRNVPSKTTSTQHSGEKSEPRWIRFDDATTYEISSEKATRDEATRRNAYMILYELDEKTFSPTT